MASCSVRFEFYCGEAQELKYTHDLPRSLVSEAQDAGQTAGYNDLFVAAVLPFMKEHEAACRAASNPFCENCGLFAMNILQSPMSWLHRAEDPFVGIWVSSVCGKGECETRIRQEIQDTMCAIAQEDPHRRPSTCMEILPCKVCGKTEGIKRCGRCKVVGYCGKEHQKADWKVHKKICIHKDG
ncbi:hypothetical protein BKA56DRAFT_599820 [Ilyonectria sp. MPI-CAGE-AT-0026]|nr:hypothetical protein BKA56DRAFT_599820 [Ilyonectria sp. MPI-CAGE-AT-0026]